MTMKSAAGQRPASTPRVRRGNADDAQRMREMLIEAALVLFAQGGPDAVSMRGLSARLGISPMTAYYYFADKNELLSALWQHVLRDVHGAVSLAVDSHRNGRDRFRAYVDAFLAFYESHPNEYRLVYLTQHAAHRTERPGPDQAPILGELLRLFRDSVGEFAAEIGADSAHRRIAEDLTVLTMFGYLQAVMVNRRYPWSDRALLRSACIRQTVLMVERCLRDGPHGVPDD